MSEGDQLSSVWPAPSAWAQFVVLSIMVFQCFILEGEHSWWSCSCTWQYVQPGQRKDVQENTFKTIQTLELFLFAYDGAMVEQKLLNYNLSSSCLTNEVELIRAQTLSAIQSTKKEWLCWLWQACLGKVWLNAYVMWQLDPISMTNQLHHWG